MPMYDHECDCGRIFEAIAKLDETEVPCQCGKTGHRIISVSGQFTSNEDAPWLRTVLDVVDKDNPASHVQEFVKHPTRTNYKRWMKGEGIVPVDYTEGGAPPVYKRPPEPDTRRTVDALMARLQKERAISI